MHLFLRSGGIHSKGHPVPPQKPPVQTAEPGATAAKGKDESSSALLPLIVLESYPHWQISQTPAWAPGSPDMHPPPGTNPGFISTLTDSSMG